MGNGLWFLGIGMATYGLGRLKDELERKETREFCREEIQRQLHPEQNEEDKETD